MSIPFSNTTLRVPRGFGNLLEGLAREVLRNQPKDIPTFAALYFSALLKEREGDVIIIIIIIISSSSATNHFKQPICYEIQSQAGEVSNLKCPGLCPSGS
uniref:RIIa domain-containing protein n=1 Tax=Anguilla anguilla TaxID=7936 RepID=A0A0E9WKT9_ANGAN